MQLATYVTKGLFRVHKQMRSFLSQFYIFQNYRSIQILPQTAPLYSISMRLAKTKIIHRQHRPGEQARWRKKRMATINQQYITESNKQSLSLNVNDDTSSERSSSQDELDTRNELIKQQQESNNRKILQSHVSCKEERVNPIQQKQTQLFTDAQHTAKFKESLLKTSQQTVQQLQKYKEPAQEEQQGSYFYLGDEDDDDQDQEGSSQSESQGELIEDQDQQDDSDQQDPKKIEEASNKQDSEDQSDDEDDLDQDYEAYFDEQIDLFDDNFMGHDDQEIQLEMDQYEQFQKQKIKEMSIPSNFNHYQLPPKEKQDFMNILNQMYYETMITEKKKRKKKEKLIELSRLPLQEEGQQQEKVQLPKRTPNKKVIFDETISYRLFNRAQTIEEMVEQQEQFEQINHLEKGKQKPIVPLQKQRIQQIIPPSESNKRTAEYLQSDRDKKKENSIKNLAEQTAAMHHQPDDKKMPKDSFYGFLAHPSKIQQFRIFQEEKEENQEIMQAQRAQDIFDDKNQSFVCNQNASAQIIGLIQPPPIVQQQTCEGI